MASPIKVTPLQVSVVGDTTAITSPELVSKLANDKIDFTQHLSAAGTPVDPSQISVDEYGRLVVKNQAFADNINQTLLAKKNADGTLTPLIIEHCTFNWTCKPK